MAENYTLGLKVKYDDNQLKRGVQSLDKNVSKMNSVLSKGAGLVAGFFAVDKITAFGGAVIDTRKEFERLETVLGVTLGSKSEAAKAFEQIQTFASRTPFAVLELSDAFVKLTNFGLKPSMVAMTAYGDLASSTGKSFDQLAEAIIDATTGEFERLKEFGVRSKKMGDKVEFTFKGVKTQVDFTSSSIEEYLINLGKGRGVTGAMAAQSKTLGGVMSNLGDNFDSFKNKLGKDFTPAVMAATKALSGFFKVLTEGITSSTLQAIFSEEIKGEAKGIIGALTKNDNKKRLVEINNVIGSISKKVESIGNKSPQYAKWVGVLKILKMEQDGINAAVERQIKKEEELAAARKKRILAGKKQGFSGSTARDLQSFTGEPSGLSKELEAASDFLGGDSNIDEILDRQIDKMDAFNADLKREQKEMIDNAVDWGHMGSAVFASAITSIASSIGGGEPIRKVWDNLLSVVGDNLQSMGASLIASGSALSALASLNPAVQIAAGIAAVAAGAAVKRAAGDNAGQVKGSTSGTTRGGGGGRQGTFRSQGQATETGGEGPSLFPNIPSSDTQEDANEWADTLVSTALTNAFIKVGELDAVSLMFPQPKEIGADSIFSIFTTEKQFKDLYSVKKTSLMASTFIDFDIEMFDPNDLIGFSKSIQAPDISFGDLRKVDPNKFISLTKLKAPEIEIPKLDFAKMQFRGFKEALQGAFGEVRFNLQGDQLVGLLSRNSDLNSRAGSGGIPVTNPSLDSIRTPNFNG